MFIGTRPHTWWRSTPWKDSEVRQWMKTGCYKFFLVLTKWINGLVKLSYHFHIFTFPLHLYAFITCHKFPNEINKSNPQNLLQAVYCDPQFYWEKSGMMDLCLILKSWTCPHNTPGKLCICKSKRKYVHEFAKYSQRAHHRSLFGLCLNTRLIMWADGELKWRLYSKLVLVVFVLLVSLKSWKIYLSSVRIIFLFCK